MALFCQATSWLVVAAGSSRLENCTLKHDAPWAASVRSSAAELAQSNATTHFKVLSWYGRFGNHFLIVRNALNHAVCCRATLELPPEEELLPQLSRFLDFSTLNGTGASCGAGYTGSGDEFFYWRRKGRDGQINSKTSPLLSPDVQCEDFNPYGALEYFLFGNSQPHGCHYHGDHCPPGLLEDDVLVVAFRSGDIFGPHPNKNYKQPPVAFYEAVFRDRPWKRILCVSSAETTELMNPVWTYYLDPANRKKMPPATFSMSTDFETDLHTLWCARNFVGASSTLSGFVIETGPYLERVYVFADKCDAVDPYVTCHRFSSPTYKLSGWTNSAEQRQAMIKTSDPRALNVTTEDAITDDGRYMFR